MQNLENMNRKQKYICITSLRLKKVESETRGQLHFAEGARNTHFSFHVIQIHFFKFTLTCVVCVSLCFERGEIQRLQQRACGEKGHPFSFLVRFFVKITFFFCLIKRMLGSDCFVSIDQIMDVINIVPFILILSPITFKILTCTCFHDKFRL